MTDPTPTPQKPGKADDRHLVAVENGDGATFEDRLFLFWKQYRLVVFIAVAVALVLIVGREGFRYHTASQDNKARAAYGAASTRDQRLAFAEQYPDHPLAGVALLGVADESFRDGEYSRAATEYARAAGVLEDKMFKDRARLGEAIASIQSGNATSGRPMLQSLANDETVAGAIRCEALLHLAAEAVASGDFAAAREALTRLQAMPDNGAWAGRAYGLSQRIPEEQLPGGAPPAE